MSSAAAVIACALSLLGRSEQTMPPITLVEAPPGYVSAQADAFVVPPEKRIFVVTSSATFRAALESRSLCNDSPAMKKLASVFAHEHWHLQNGSDESAAYHEQLKTLIRLGVPADGTLYRSVQRSLLQVLKERNRKPDLVIAGGG